ncbi:MAG: tRNA-dependent cyclodipeptide synthase [Synechococcus sp.]
MPSDNERCKIDQYNYCILGISLENPSFSSEKLLAMTDWIATHFQKCYVLIGDSLHRITLQLDQKLSDKQALDRAILMGKEYINIHMNIFRHYENNCHFEFIYCSKIQQKKEYREYYKQIKDLFDKNREFKNSVNSFSREFVRRRIPLNKESHSLDKILANSNRSFSKGSFNGQIHFKDKGKFSESYIELCDEYLLEELAIFSCLYKDRVCPMFYPGSFSIFEEIYKGEHAEIPACLNNIIYGTLRLKRRKN